MANAFYFDNLFDEHGERVYDLMEGVLTEIIDPNIVLETITNRKSYLANKPAEKNIVVEEAKETKTLDDKSAKSAVYNTYTDKERDKLNLVFRQLFFYNRRQFHFSVTDNIHQPDCIPIRTVEDLLYQMTKLA